MDCSHINIMLKKANIRDIYHLVGKRYNQVTVQACELSKMLIVSIPQNGNF